MKEMQIMLVCPDCHNDLFHVYETGEILCSNPECGCEICPKEEAGDLLQLH